MKPRWHFALMSALFALAVACTALVLLYLASLSVFLLRESGVWFAPSFGARGWFAFARSIPLWYVAVIALFIFILEAMIRRYALVYRRPLAGSFVGVAAIILVGGIVIGQTSLHKEIASYARAHALPAPFNLPYGMRTRVALPADVYEGTVIAKENGAFVIEHKSGGDNDADDGHWHIATSATTTPLETVRNNQNKNDHKDEARRSRGKKQTRIMITPHTRLPHKRDFEIGSRVVVQGDSVATDTIEALGVRDIED